MATATRQERAAALAQDVDRWNWRQTSSGLVVAEVPSTSEPGVRHTTTHEHCSCWAGRMRRGEPCVHQLAVRAVMREHGLL